MPDEEEHAFALRMDAAVTATPENRWSPGSRGVLTRNADTCDRCRQRASRNTPVLWDIENSTKQGEKEPAAHKVSAC
jgi:hypothetical protein